MTLNPSTFGYLPPTPEQMSLMQQARAAADNYAHALDRILPEGPDKTDVIRQLRTLAMWANVCITRYADGSPRTN